MFDPFVIRPAFISNARSVVWRQREAQKSRDNPVEEVPKMGEALVPAGNHSVRSLFHRHAMKLHAIPR